MGEAPGEGRRAVVYCVVPRELAAKLHEPLRRHFSEERAVEVVVEQRVGERRGGAERRAGASGPAGSDRRAIHNPTGRRVADRRAGTLTVPAPPLPRRLQRHAEHLVFVECLEPSGLEAEDVDTARLVTRIQGGEKDAFGELYMRYFDRVFAYLRVALSDEHAAEDLTQQVFAKVLAGLARYERRPGHLFRAWLFVIVRNEALRELTKRSRSEVTDPTVIDHHRESEQDSGWEIDLTALSWVSDRDLLFLIERLPVPQRQVLMLRFMLDLPSSEVASILGRSSEDVRALQYRALRFLRERLTALGRGPRRRGGVPMGRFRKQYGVLRARRFALH